MLAAAMCYPALVFRVEGPFECKGGMAAFRTLMDLQVGDDVDTKTHIMSALAQMRSQTGRYLAY